jgi:type IV secretory pathway TraG/TraD family ATPase VirD4
MNLATVIYAVRDSGSVLGVAAVVLAVVCVGRLGSRSMPEIHKRGVVVTARTVARRRARSKLSDSGLLNLAGVEILVEDETKHFKFIGTTGTGKSTAIRELLRGAIARGDRAIFADPDGGYAASFYNRYRGDLVLNPFERDSPKWDLFAEIKDSYDVEQTVAALIPDCEDASAREWRTYGRTFLAAVIRGCVSSGRRNMDELWRLLMVASADELRPLVAATPAQPFLDPDNARMFGSIRAVMGSAIAALDFIRTQRTAPFSIRRWVNDRGRQSILFIPYKASQIAALRSIIAAWMRLAIFEAMGGPQDHDQRLWFVVDELDSLGPIDGLKDALARLRKFGCRCVLGFQSIAQVSSTYGQGDAQTIVENCANTLILRCSGSENGGTSQFASRLIGDREILRRQVSRGKDRESAFSTKGGRRSRSITEQHVTEPAVMPSELEKLPDLSGYLKSASASVWLKVAFHHADPRS